jgi:two-component system, cell cycle response regulator DivK
MAKKILVVEDNEDARFILVMILRRAGYLTIEAASGDQATEKALDESPDLIIMDLGLPGMSGIAATKAIKANAKSARIPVVAYSAWSAAQFKEEALKAGMLDYFEKPMPAELMRANIARVLTPEDQHFR